MNQLTATLTLRLSPPLRRQLEERAAQEERKPSDLARLLIAEGLSARELADAVTADGR